MPLTEFNVAERVDAIRTVARGGHLGIALRAIVDLVNEVAADDSTHVRVFDSLELDMLTLELGNFAFPSRRLVSKRASAARKGTVIIATALYRRGGHTRIIEDLLREEAFRDATILLTGLDHQLVPQQARAFIPDHVPVEIAPKGSLAHQLRWLQDRLASLAPSRTFLFQHPFDCVAVAAAQAELTGQLYFVHHADHTLSLGVHLPHAIHIDFHAKSFWRCRRDGGLPENCFWPLTGGLDELPARMPQHEANLTTCCSGGPEKFEPVGGMTIPYQVDYADVVARTLASTSGHHVHLGPLSDRLIDRIADRCSKIGAPVDRFRNIPLVRDLATALTDNNVDLYMGSIRRGGGKALVEAMSSGIALLLHDNYRSVYFSDAVDAFDGVRSWRTLGDLSRELAQFSPEALAEGQRLSRQFYEARHSRAMFSVAVTALLEGRRSEAPPVKPHKADQVQNFFDERNAFIAEGFRIARPLHVLESRVIGFEPGLLRAHIDSATADQDGVELIGWAIANPAITSIVVFHNSIEVGRFIPDISRPDVDKTFLDVRQDHAGFRLAWTVVRDDVMSDEIRLEFLSDDLAVGMAEYVLEVAAAENGMSDVDPVGADALLTLVEKDWRPANGTAMFEIDSYFARRTSARIVGWVLGLPRVTEIRFSRGDVQVGRTVPAIRRPDVYTAFPSFAEHNAGFAFDCPLRDTIHPRHQLTLTLVSGVQELGSALLTFEASKP